MQDVVILITTFQRDDLFFQCVKSIREFYPDIAIFSVDTGRQKEEDGVLNIEYKYTQYRLQFDAGVCAAKNEGLRRIPEKYKYIIILEDDVIFTENTRLEIWYDILERREHIGIIGGAFTKDDGRGHRRPQQYEATLDIKDNAIHLEKMEHPLPSRWERLSNIRFFYCDVVINCFMMRRAVWNDVKWDERFKTSPEHTDFFLSVKKKTKWRVAFTDQVNIDHVPDYSNADYMKYRSRSFGYKVLADKWKVKYYYNSWHPQWGIKNPMDLKLYSVLRKLPTENVKPTTKVTKPTKKVEFKDRMRIAIGIKTFLREEMLFKTLDSIEHNFPYPYKIYIADDSPASYRKEHRYSELERKGHQILRLSYNSGVSVGRNAIIDEAKEDYILIMDDDFLIEDPASIINMKRVLDHHEKIGVCAGMLFLENGQHWGTERYNQGLTLEIEDGILYRWSHNREVQEFYGVKFLYADQVVNFFLARREMFKDVRWDDAIKTEYEHMDFFIRLKDTGWKTAVCLDTKAIHQTPIPHNYTYNQCRRNAPTEYFYKKHGITGIENQFLRGR